MTSPVHLMKHWPGLAARLAREPLGLLTDFDGTLAPIAARPDEALLADSTRILLRQVMQLPGVRLGIISGRALQDLRRQVGIPALLYAGNHGWELRAPGVSFRHPQAARLRRAVRRVAEQAARAIDGIPGAWMEWKGITASLHWRLIAPGDRSRFHRAVADSTRPWVRQEIVRLRRAKRVVEVWPPVDWHKGRIVPWILAHVPGWRGRHLIYLGDDHTDEDGFRAVNRLGGVSVIITTGRRKTAARYRLRDHDEVTEWLAALCVYRAGPSRR